MFLKYPARVVLAAAIISLISFSPASSRQWKTTPQILARDYAGITDSRPGETVMITWFVPQMMQPNATPAIAMTQKYVVLMVAHSRFDKVTGVNSYEDISALNLRTRMGMRLLLLLGLICRLQASLCSPDWKRFYASRLGLSAKV